ncbi:unnamed protein product [Lactuca saligna]|uniref:Uncharacterized protein n=1 Tax=Lactuca saligna TaxID=75948 RepID=A0AA36DVJ9_LACSI|nr:unnamed protein product [Lactuca saligna]
MSASSSSSEVSVKLLIDTKAKKVLFAEANKQFVDFLFHILSLPIGTVIKLLNKTSMVGSLGNLYESIENLSDTYMQPNRSKNSVLNPKTVKYGAHVPLLLTPNDHNIPMAQKFYRCHSCYSNVTDDPDVICPRCRHYHMSTQLTFVSGGGMLNGTAEGGGFVKEVVTYMVSDDLVVKPMSTISSLTMLNKFNVKEIGCLEEKVISLEMKESFSLFEITQSSDSRVPSMVVHSNGIGGDSVSSNLDSTIPTIRIKRAKRGLKDKINLPEISSDFLINYGRKQLEKEVEMFRSLLQKPVNHYSRNRDGKVASMSGEGSRFIA